jgi:hypothetical protein
MLIGLTGRARAGKDTAALALRPLGFARVSFADPIRDMLEALGMRRADMDGPNKEIVLPQFGFSYRRAAQTLGTEWGRNLNPSLWLDVARHRIDALRQSGTPHVVLTDVRFDNEARLVHELGGKVLEIVRPDATPVLRHASEQGVAPGLVDAVLFNTGALPGFVVNVRYLAQCWLEGRDEAVAHFAGARSRVGPVDV